MIIFSELSLIVLISKEVGLPFLLGVCAYVYIQNRSVAVFTIVQKSVNNQFAVGSNFTTVSVV